MSTYRPVGWLPAHAALVGASVAFGVALRVLWAWLEGLS